MPGDDVRTIRFADIALDLDRGLLQRDGMLVPARAKSFAMLVFLAQHPNRVITKDALIEAVWGRSVVTDDNLAQTVKDVRRAIGDLEGRRLRAIPRRGYLFQLESDDERPSTAAHKPVAGADEVTLAVLPFANLTGQAEQEFFADGMAEDIIGALSRLGGLVVIARSSTLAYKGRAVSAEAAARELGVRYILEGSIRVAGQRARVGAQLVDGTSGRQLLAERYDVGLDDLFAVQDEITRSIVIALQVKLGQGESARLWDGQTRNLGAWEKMIRGREAFQRYNSFDNAIARSLLREAIALDPGYTSAIAFLGISHYWDHRYSPSVDPAKALRQAEEQIDILHRLDPHSNSTLMLEGAVALIRDQHDEAVALCERAVERAPSDPWAVGFLGMIQVYADEIVRALATFGMAKRLTPRPGSWLTYYLALAHLWLGHNETALDYATRHRELEPQDPHGQVYLAAILALLGRIREAEATVARLRRQLPGFGIDDLRRSEHYRDGAKTERLVAALRRAGLPG